MFLKGVLYTLYNNKLVKFYPKTLAEQVLIDKTSSVTLLDMLRSISTGEEEIISKYIRDIMDEVVPDTALISLPHGLACYPDVRIISGKNGLGVSGLGEASLGGNDVNSLVCKVGYDDRNNITLYVPKNYVIPNPQIEKIDDNQYMLTFTDSIVSMIIDLIIL